jgi:hypothetical protein
VLCRDDFVVPVWWEPLDNDQWRMLLRCGQCDTYRDVVVGTELAKAFERDLDRGAREIRIALSRLDRERMAAETEAFVVALRHDLIDAGDFAGR